MKHLLVALWASTAFCNPWLDQWADDFTFNDKSFSGDWTDRRHWNGTLCEGRAYYRGRIGGEISEIKFKLMDGYIEVTGNLKNIWGHLEGSYRSSYSACTTLSGWIGLRSDWAYLKANVHLNPPDATTPVKRLEIVQTELGRLHFGLWLPDYLEEYATNLANWGLARVWSSRVGAWINDRITQEIKKRGGGKDALGLGVGARNGSFELGQTRSDSDL